jgi:hypothetical protein
MGLLGGARSRSLGTEGAEALPRWDPPASCPCWLSNTTCGAPSSRRARGTARMRVPSSSLTLRSEAPVRTLRGSGFEPLISRAVRGRAWTAPSFRVCGRRGVWASQPSRCWLLVQRGMGACGARFTSSRPWATLLTRVPSRRGLTLSRAGGSLRSRVLHGMGARGCLLYIEQVPGDLLTSISHRGLTSS